MKRGMVVLFLVLSLGACANGRPYDPGNFPPEKTVGGANCKVKSDGKIDGDCYLEDRKHVQQPIIIVPVESSGFLGIGGSKPCGPYGCAPVYHDGSVGPIPSVPAGWNGAGAWGPGPGWAFEFHRRGGRNW